MLYNSTTSKRKAPDDEPNANAEGVMNANSMTATSNPLINASKKAKRESKTGASKKRKLANAEEAPGGLFIVRTQIPPSSSLPIPTTAPAIAKPPAKKFKSFQPLHPQAQPPPSTLTRQPPPSRLSLLPPSQPATLARYSTPDADPALDAAVRAMDTEAADLRRLSRAPQTPDASSSGSSSKSKFQYSTPSVSRPTSSGNGQGKRRGTERIVDTSAPLHAEEDETPQIQRNKRLRAGAMAAISSGSETETGGEMTLDPVTPPRKPGGVQGSTRRKSSVGRGKRISTSFEATGIITQPHNSVADTAFYKHIDSDLPDSERVRQLLIWCSARVASTASSSSPSNPPLPKLSAAAEAALKATQEDIVRRLAERRVDLSLFRGPGDANSDSGTNVILAENKQNVTNRMWEGVYSRDIRRAEEEEEAWKKVSSAYDTCARRIRSAIEKRRVDLGVLAPSTSSPLPSSAGTGSPSAKVQGKQRAPSLELREQDLLPSSRAGFRLARKVLARSRRRKVVGLEETPGAGSSMSADASTGKGMDPDSRPLPMSSQDYGVGIDADVEMEEDAARKEAETEEAAEKGFRQRMRDVEFKLDHLFVMASQARQTTEVAQMALDARFGVLARALDVRRAGSSGTGGAFPSTSTAGKTPVSVLGRYVSGGVDAGMGGRGIKDREEADEALALLRALARVDAERPPVQVGDAARRAVREAQRAGDASERKITEVPVGNGGVGLTPRKMRGTPRRGTTPGR